MKKAMAVLCLGLCLGLWLGSGHSIALAGERFTDKGDGVVIDHQLGLMWAKFDNQGNITWKKALRYCKMGPPQILGKYDNWRLPTPDELAGLFDKNSRGYETACGQVVKIFPAIKLSCGWVWTSEKKSITAVVYSFQRGYRFTDRQVHNKHYRALPVRSLKAGK